MVVVTIVVIVAALIGVMMYQSKIAKNPIDSDRGKVMDSISKITVNPINVERAKARDAKRISDVKQMSNYLSIEDTNVYGQNIQGCISENSLSESCTGPGEVSNISQFKDPGKGTSPCSTSSHTVCQYSIGARSIAAPAKTNDYQICFFLENGYARLSQGLHAMTDTGAFADCTLK